MSEPLDADRKADCLHQHTPLALKHMTDHAVVTPPQKGALPAFKSVCGESTSSTALLSTASTNCTTWAKVVLCSTVFAALLAPGQMQKHVDMEATMAAQHHLAD